MCTLDLTGGLLRGAVIVQARGDVDLCSAPALERHLSAVLAGQAPAIVLDLSAVTFLDCAGLRVLLAARRRAASQGSPFSLAAPQRAVTRLLQLTALDRHFTVFPTVAAAVAAGDSGPHPIPRLPTRLRPGEVPRHRGVPGRAPAAAPGPLWPQVVAGAEVPGG